MGHHKTPFPKCKDKTLRELWGYLATNIQKDLININLYVPLSIEKTLFVTYFIKNDCYMVF